MKKRYLMLIIISTIVVIFTIGLYLKTGFLQKDKIDTRDLTYWNYTKEGVIVGTEGYVLNGNNESCWLLVHGYTSTPIEMKELATEINNEFNESVIVPRLIGHGEIPSHILNLTLDDWYNQVEGEFEKLELECENVNVVGFSFGGTLSLKLAEKKEIQRLYLISPYLKARYKWIRIFPLEYYVDLFGDLVTYSIKISVAQINSPEGLSKHIAYWNMPFAPVKDSKNFIKERVANAKLIKETVLVQHSSGDETADIDGAIEVFQKMNSTDKTMIVLDKSNHVILADYDKEAAINNIINFEKDRRI
jgi:carboxylesterase